MRTPFPLPSVSTRTKSSFIALLVCGGASILTPLTAGAGQTASISVVKDIPGSAPSGQQGLNLPPVTPPFKASDGNFYGLAPVGGVYGDGIVFKITPAGVFSVLHHFHDDEFSTPLVEDGSEPRVLIEGADHNLYGVCYDGGKNDDDVYHNGAGTIFQITQANGKITFTKLYDFDKGNPNTTLANPVAFVQGKDGSFYGLTNQGGTKKVDSAGAFFKFVPGTKTLTELYDFTNTTTIGIEPKAQLLAAADGSGFYGTTTNDGGSDPNDAALGTIFKITTAGVPTLVHVFQFDGDNPQLDVPQPDDTALILGTDGFLYGASTSQGGENDGTVYRCAPNGASFKLLHVFTGGADGGNPVGGLVQGTDGNFYGGLRLGFGTTPDSEQLGGYYQITAAGVFTVLYRFSPGNENNPFEAASALAKIGPGQYYGLTQGGTGGIGTVAKLIVSPAIKSALTASGTVGKAFSYQILATNNPTAYGAPGLPAGLSLNGTTGIISGTPTKAGTYKITLKAANTGGTGSAVLTLTIKAQ